TDPQRDERVIRFERVELRRGRLVGREVLRVEHVVRRRATAARVGEAGGGGLAPHDLRVVVGGAAAQGRVGGRQRDERRGCVRVAKRDVWTRSRAGGCGDRGERECEYDTDQKPSAHLELLSVSWIEREDIVRACAWG